jgi:hypothetical protein
MNSRRITLSRVAVLPRWIRCAVNLVGDKVSVRSSTVFNSKFCSGR